MENTQSPVSIDVFFCGEEYHTKTLVDQATCDVLDSPEVKTAVMAEIERILWPQLKRSARIRQFKRAEKDIQNYQVTLHWENKQDDGPDPDSGSIWQNDQSDKNVGYVDVLKMMGKERDALDSQFYSANTFLSRLYPFYVTPGKTLLVY